MQTIGLEKSEHGFSCQHVCFFLLEQTASVSNSSAQQEESKRKDERLIEDNGAGYQKSLLKVS